MIYVYCEDEQWVGFKVLGGNEKNFWGYQAEGFGWLFEVEWHHFEV